MPADQIGARILHRIPMFAVDHSVDRKLCFVIMPFAPSLRPVFETIKEVVERDHDMICQRADDIYSDGVVIEEVWQFICRAQIVIADATGRNANVFYEMGMAHSLNKHMIIITGDSPADLPFDLRHRRVIHYTLASLNLLRDPLHKTVAALKWIPPTIHQWIGTDKSEIRIGLARPIDGATVFESPIESLGRVVGLPHGKLRHFIKGYVITNKTYPQGAAWIDEDGYWRIPEIHFGGTEHHLYFRICDEADRRIAKSQQVTVTRRIPPP
jgi:hypothetical protein